MKESSFQQCVLSETKCVRQLPLPTVTPSTHTHTHTHSKAKLWIVQHCRAISAVSELLLSLHLCCREGRCLYRWFFSLVCFSSQHMSPWSWPWTLRVTLWSVLWELIHSLLTSVIAVRCTAVKPRLCNCLCVDCVALTLVQHVTHSGPEVFFKTCVAMKFVDDDDWTFS